MIFFVNMVTIQNVTDTDVFRFEERLMGTQKVPNLQVVFLSSSRDDVICIRRDAHPWKSFTRVDSVDFHLFTSFKPPQFHVTALGSRDDGPGKEM